MKLWIAILLLLPTLAFSQSYKDGIVVIQFSADFVQANEIDISKLEGADMLRLYLTQHPKIFKKENINFNVEGTHYDYFFHFFYESFYLKKDDEHLEKLKHFLNILFILHTDKTKSELDMLYEIYILLNESLTVK